MRKLFSLSVIIFAVYLFSACTAPKSLVINIQKPAQVSLPQSIESIIIVNNLVVQPPTQGNTIKKFDKTGNAIYEEISVPTDSLGTILSETLYDKLAALNSFKEVSIYDKSLRDDLSFQEIRPIDSLAVKDICAISNSDAILSLDRFYLVSNSKEDIDELGIKLNDLDLKMSASFSIYSKEGRLISNSLTMVDSIYWSALYHGKHLVSDFPLPSREDALKEAARYAGEKLADALVPYWDEVPRLYYNETKEAVVLAEKDQWGEALTVWLTAYNNELKDKRKARIAFNIALAYELTDNLKEAINWINTASSLFQKSGTTSVDLQNSQRAEEYKKELLSRFGDFKLLDITRRAED